MGLEAGWNCHISLLSEKDTKKASNYPSQPDLSQSSNSNRASRYSNRHSTESIHTRVNAAQPRARQNPDLNRCRRYSAPGAINTEAPQVKFESKEISSMMDGENTSCEVNTLPEDEASGVDKYNDSESDSRVQCDTKEPLLKETGNDTIVNTSVESKSKSKGYSIKDISSKTPSPQNLKQDGVKSNRAEDNDSEPLLPKADKDASLETSDPPLASDASILRSEVTDGCEDSENIELSDVRHEDDEDEEVMNNIRCYSTESFPASSYVTENTDSMTGVLGLSNRVSSTYRNTNPICSTF